MGAANGTPFRLVDAEVELRRETRDFARWTLVDVEELHRRFKKTFGFAVTASQFQSLLLLKTPESVGVDEIFDVLDTNRDGRVDGLELLAALACVCRATFEDKARFAFDLFDFNHNGSLSLAELALLMKSVLIGMTLLTGGGPESSALSLLQSGPDAKSSMEAMTLCLSLAETAFSDVDDAKSVLGFEDFITWARSNRAFMLQVERFRLIAEKAVGFEDALSLPDGSDDDSDVDMEEAGKLNRSQESVLDLQSSNSGKRSEMPPPWLLEPISSPLQNTSALAWKQSGMPPPANLQLEWVYGTCGPLARNACRLVATGEAVYFVGSYVVLYSSECHKQRYYCGHRRAIGCLDVNASREIVATGDAWASHTTNDNSGAEIHVWHAQSLQCLAVLRNFHPTGVAHVCFPAPASAATATLRQTQTLSFGDRPGTGGNSSAVLSSHLMKKKPRETEALIASIGIDGGASMALWNWQKEAIVASGRAHPAASGKRARTNGKRPLALALNEDGDELVVVGAHFVVFHQVGGRFFKHKKPHWHGAVDPPLHTVPACLSAVYYGIQTAVVGTARGELLLFERHVLTRCIQAHDVQTSVNVCFLSCQSMVLFSAGKDGQIKQWDSTLGSIGQTLDLHALLPRTPSLASSLFGPENVLEGDKFRISSLDYDAQRKRFLVATRAGNIFEIDDEVPSASSNTTMTNTFRWKIVASGHAGQPTHSIATANVVGGCFASCGSGQRCVKIWSLRRRACVQLLRLPGATAAPSALEFSSDGERLAVGSEDGTVMLARRIGAASSNVMTIEATMKNTNAAVLAMRFGPLTSEPLLAVTRDNGYIYMYKLELGGRRFVRCMLLRPQAGDDVLGNACDLAPAHALDFSVDGAFLRTQHGNLTLSFWDLRQHAGTRVTSMATLRNVQWYTHSTSIGWDVSGLPSSSYANVGGDCVVANTTQGLTLVLSSDGNIHLAPFPCPRSSSAANDSSEPCWLSRRVLQAHLNDEVSLFGSSSHQLSMCGDFALRGSVVITSSKFDPAICQWRVEKELGDVQPRPVCLYDQALYKRLELVGLQDIYFDVGSFDDDDKQETRADLTDLRVISRNSRTKASQTVVGRRPGETLPQRSETPDLALTLSYVYGFNHRSMSLNQSLACLGNGSYVYSAGTLLLVRHLHSLGPRQRIVASGLHYSVSCLVKHPSEPVLAVGSRQDGHVKLLRTTKAPASSPASDESFQLVTTLKSDMIPTTLTNEKNLLINVNFYDSKDSTTCSIQSDLVAAIWKNTRSHVHTLVFYAWKRQLLLAHTPMTCLPVLFGTFAGSSDTDVHFVSGGVDHLTFWRLNPATRHVIAQQGVFGRHALVQTLLCAVHVFPFVLTGGEDGSIVLWESDVAAYTTHPSTSRASSGEDAIVALEHLQPSQIVLGALRNGSLSIWKYSMARSPSRSTTTSGSRMQASSFLQLMRVVRVHDASLAPSTRAVSPLFLATTFSKSSPSATTHVQGMHLLQDASIAALVLSNGLVLSVELELLIDGPIETNQTNAATFDAGKKARALMDFSSTINDVALHPKDLRWASASADGTVCLWTLHPTRLSHQQAMPHVPCSLAWSSAGDHLAVSLLNGLVVILEGATLELLLQFSCGDTDASNGQPRATTFPNWCTLVKYSPQDTQAGSNTSRSWLALACRDFSIYVYAWETTDTSPPVYSLQHTFVGHTAPIEAIDFSLDGEWLQSATSSNDRQLLRWALQKKALSNGNSESSRDAMTGWELLDDAWASWTSTFAGPVQGLVECCGVGKTTALARINGELGSSNEAESTAIGKNWSSPLPTIVAGLEDGRLVVAWYPLVRGDVAVPVSSAESECLIDPAVVIKEYTGYFPRDASIRRVAFSFSNAFVVALARNGNGNTQVLVWQTDYEDEVRLRQRFAMKSVVSLETSPSWYSSPVERHLFEECVRVQRTNEPHQRRQEAEESSDKWIELDRAVDVPTSEQELHLEFVYGLNPSATGSRNVFYADDTWEIVYAAGACGVVYNTKTQTQLLNYNTASERRSVISALSVHPKGDLIASGECLVPGSWTLRDPPVPEIVLWDANSSNTVVRVPTKHRPGVLLLEFSMEGHRLASIGMESEHTLAIYAISGGGSEGGRLHATLLVVSKTSARRVWGLSFGEDGDLATCGDQHIFFWQQGNARSGGEDGSCPGLKSGLLTSHKECKPQATLLQVVHMTGHAQLVVSSQADGSLYAWKDRVCVIVRRDAHGDAPIPALAVDRKHSMLYSAGADSRICVWNAQLELVRVVADIAQLNATGGSFLPLTSTGIQSLAVRDGHVLFSTAGSEVCELIDAGSQQPSTQRSMAKDWRLNVYVRGHATGRFSGLAVHPCKSAQFASAGDDGIVRLWDAATRSLLAVHRCESTAESVTKGEVRALAFSTDGKHLAVGTLLGVVRVLSATLDAVVTQWSCWHDRQQGHAVLALQYSRCGTLLAVACQDGSVHVYNVAGYRKMTVLQGCAQNVDAIDLDFARNQAALCAQFNTGKDQELWCWELGSWKTMSIREAQWESTRVPSRVDGARPSQDCNGAAVACGGGHATPVMSWIVTKNEHYLLSSGCGDRIICQFRLEGDNSIKK